MNLTEVFLRQGIIGIICPLAFAVLAILAIIYGITRSKSVGYAYLTGAWSIGATFTAVVSSHMLAVANHEAGVAGMQMFATNLSAISFFCEPAAIVSLIVVILLAAVRFNRNHLLAEILLAITLCLLIVTLRFYMQSFLMTLG